MLRCNPDALARELRLAVSAHWYQQGRVSQEWAADIAGMDRADFPRALSSMGKDSFEPVTSEILRRGRHDISARAIEQTGWLIITPVAHIPTAITEWGLGAGESSVLALAHPGAEAIIDDLAGRKCAARLSIPVRGALGIVLIARNRGLIPKARPVLNNAEGRQNASTASAVIPAKAGI